MSRARGGSSRRTPPASPWDVAAGALPRVAPARRSGDPPSHRMDAGSAGDVRRSGSPGPSSLETVLEADFGAGLGYAGPAVDDQAALWCDGGRPPLEQEAEHVPVVGCAVPRPVGPEPAGLPRPGPSARPPASPFLSSRCRRSRPPLPRGMSCSTTRAGATRASSLVAWYRAALWATAKR